MLLEKPPVASMREFETLVSLAASLGRVVQVGFQSLGSHLLREVDDPSRAAELGLTDIRSIGAIGTWTRSRDYWSRSVWAGHRTLDGVDVVDGVVTNPLAHAVATALALAGARRRGDVISVETDLYRANDIESDDTSVVRIRTRSGVTVTAALTLAGPSHPTPVVRVHGAAAAVDFRYTEDELVHADGNVVRFDRTDLMENLLDHREHGTPLLVPLVDTGAFVEVTEAVRTASAPARIPPEYVTWVGDGGAAHPVIADIEHWVERAADTGSTFAELDAPWAQTV